MTLRSGCSPIKSRQDDMITDSINRSKTEGDWMPEQMHVLDVRPGITDLASIKFRNENGLMEIKRQGVF